MSSQVDLRVSQPTRTIVWFSCGACSTVALKKPAVVNPNIVLEIRGIRKHRGWNNLLRRAYTYINNHLTDYVSSYRFRFLPSLRFWNQLNYRRLLNHHLLLDTSHQNKRCISFYIILNEFENNINHIQSGEATLRLKSSPKINTFLSFYVQQVFHNFSFIYYKYNKYNNQSQVVNKLALL